MSVEVTSVPLWKQTLLDKKRRQNEDCRRSEEEEVNKLSSLPNWKKDLLFKRHTQKNSLVFIGREKQKSIDENEVGNTVCDKDQEPGQVSHHDHDQTVSNRVVIVEPCDSDLSPVPSEKKEHSTSKDSLAEHLLPVKQNPWLRSDKVRQKHGQKRYSDTNMLQDYQSSENHAVNHTSWSGDADIMRETKQDGEDSVFEEEVTYGKGFVHKLLRRFSRFSSPEDCDRGRKSSRTPSSRRCHSAENLLDDNRSHSPISPRNFTSSYTDSISPRSPTRSRSTDSIPSPRSPNDDDTTTQLDNKMGVADKSGVGTSVYDSADNSQNSSLLSPSWENISEAEDQLPKKNIVASTRNVFEQIAGPTKPEKKTKPIAPQPVRSPRNSVHSLIAIDNSSSKEESDRLPVSPTSESSDKAISSESSIGTRSVRFDANPKKSEVGISSNSRNTTPSLVANSDVISKNVDSTVKKSQVEPNLNSSKISERGQTVDRKPSKNADQSGGQSYYDLYFNSKSQSQNRESNTLVTLTDTANGVLLNGDLGESSTEDSNQVVTTPTSPKSEPSFKKRKAPPPPKPAVRNDRVKVNSEDSANSIVNGSVITNGVTKDNGPILNDSQHKQNSKPVITTSKPVSARPVYNQTKPVNNQQKQTNISHSEPPLTETKRQNLNLNLNEISKKPEVVKSSRGSSNDAYSVINSRANKKAKIVTPKSSGPGSLLIRPASNMIQAKNAQFAKLEFKYDDIRTGEFAPPKKKPAYYDDDSSDEDIPVTNIDDIDDVIDEARGRDRNANIAKKAGKYEFIGAGVICGKSSLTKRRKEVKTSIQFTDQTHTCYEYPSEQSLMADTPARPGDYDFIDDTMTNGRDDSDDDDDVMTLEVETVTSANLKNNPAVGHSGPLSGYQSKMQFEYHFGMNVQEEEPPAVTRQQRVPSVQEEDYMRPAEEDETSQWSKTATSDLLF